MPKVRIGVTGSDFRPDAEKASISFFHDSFRCDGFGEAWPTGSGIVFIQRAKQGLARHHIDIDSVFFKIPICVFIGSLCGVSLCYIELFFGKLLSQSHNIGLGIHKLSRKKGDGWKRRGGAATEGGEGLLLSKQRSIRRLCRLK